jgi:hypothetical protein
MPVILEQQITEKLNARFCCLLYSLIRMYAFWVNFQFEGRARELEDITAEWMIMIYWQKPLLLSRNNCFANKLYRTTEEHKRLQLSNATDPSSVRLHA